MTFMKFRLMRLVTGLPLFLFGNIVAMIPVGWTIWYLLGCMIALVGSYVISRMIDYSLTGIGFVLFGTPVFFLSMLPHAYQWTGMDTPTVFAIRLVTSFTGAVMMMASINSES